MIAFWYNLVDFLLPFSWVQHNFMKNALLAILLLTPILAMLGTMIVNNQMAFFSDSLGHSALTGIALGVLLGMKSPLWSLILFSVVFAVAIILVKNARTASTDTVIGVFSSTAVALGIVILSRNGGFNKYSVYLIGDVLSITPADLLALGLLMLSVVILWIICFNKLLLASVNQSLARSRGVNVRFYDYLFAIVMAVVVALSIQWVGILIISSLLVLPAAASRNMARNIKEYHLWAMVIALVSGFLGLVISYYLGTATGATIVLILAVFYGGTLIWKINH